MRLPKYLLVGVVVGAILCLMAGTGQAVVVTLHLSNVGIGSMTYSVVGTTITINETWTSTAPGYLEIWDLPAATNYTVVKNITNNTGSDWTSLANELLDPAGQQEDTDYDPLPYPVWVPAGFSTSNDTDGLHFAQGSGLPRTSTVFPLLIVDELTNARDFLDFYGGTLVNGGTDVMTYGLRDNDADNQPFLLSQRPNKFSGVIPEPASVIVWSLLAGIGLALFGYRRGR